jgi:hypothetical protein
VILCPWVAEFVAADRSCDLRTVPAVLLHSILSAACEYASRIASIGKTVPRKDRKRAVDLLTE